jgi:hypothetical protein
MRSKLFTSILVPAILAVTALVAMPASAQTKTLKVPFNFTVAGQICPAGEYSVQWYSRLNLVQLESKDASQTFSWVARSAPANEGRVTLKFDQDGANHTLESVQFGPVITAKLVETASKTRVQSTQSSSGR